MHEYTYTHTHTHTHTHTRTHTIRVASLTWRTGIGEVHRNHTKTHISTHKYINTHTYIRTHIYPQIYTYKFALTGDNNPPIHSMYFSELIFHLFFTYFSLLFHLFFTYFSLIFLHFSYRHRERWSLVQEEKQILLDLEKDVNNKDKEKENEAKDVRLGEIYEQLQQINASSKESKARRILFGLGFNKEMQVRPTKYFSGELMKRKLSSFFLFIDQTHNVK